MDKLVETGNRTVYGVDVSSEIYMGIVVGSRGGLVQ